MNHLLIVPDREPLAGNGAVCAPAAMTPEVLGAALELLPRHPGNDGSGTGVVTVAGELPRWGWELVRDALGRENYRRGQARHELRWRNRRFRFDRDEGLGELIADLGVTFVAHLNGGGEDLTGDGRLPQLMADISRARNYGLAVRATTAFTPGTIGRWRELLELLLAERLDLEIGFTPLVPGNQEKPVGAENSAAAGRELCNFFDAYRENCQQISIDFFDAACRAIGAGKKVGLFPATAPEMLVIGPSGVIYPALQVCDLETCGLGNVLDRPGLSVLTAAPLIRRILERARRPAAACTGCGHFAYCGGGIPSREWLTDPDCNGQADPNCGLYRTLFDHIASSYHRDAAARRESQASASAFDLQTAFLPKGRLDELAHFAVPVSLLRRNAERLVGLETLAREADPVAAAAHLAASGVAGSHDYRRGLLTALRRELDRPVALSNIYIHVTFQCQMACAPCYIRPEACAGFQSPEKTERIIREAAAAGFGKIVIIGGEPLLHPERRELLARLAAVRARVRPARISLRTNLAMDLNDETVALVLESADEIVVSVDGDEQTHDRRRGAGAYNRTVRNLERLVRRTEYCPEAGKLRITAVLGEDEKRGAAGRAVRELAQRLGSGAPRFNQLLPLGREARVAPFPERERKLRLTALARPVYPTKSCGIGTNLSVWPSGEAYACHVYHGSGPSFGNVIVLGLPAVVNSAAFQALRRHTAETNAKCRCCHLRYLCGGTVCRAFSEDTLSHDPDAPVLCEGHLEREIARLLLALARDYLKTEK